MLFKGVTTEKTTQIQILKNILLSILEIINVSLINERRGIAVQLFTI